MTVTVKLIIKVMDNSAISIILDDDKIPNNSLSNLFPDLDHTINYLAKSYNIHEVYVKPKLVYFGTANCPEVYYTIIAPKEFLDEKTISKLSNNFEKLSEQDRIAIRQAISLPPY